MLFRSLAVDWRVGKCSISAINLLRLPYEVLEQVAFVLGKNEVFGLFHYAAEIGNQSLPFSGEPLGWAG